VVQDDVSGASRAKLEAYLAGAGGAAIAGPASNTAIPTHALRTPDVADWIVIMVTPLVFLSRSSLSLSRYYIPVSIAMHLIARQSRTWTEIRNVARNHF